MSAGAATPDVVIVGAGAAGLATAIFAARAAPDARILCLDGAARPGAKILVSGGSRCNVTNREVTERDFWGGSPRVVRNVLRAFPAARAARFFEELGVSLHEEEDGKLFPNTNRARTVLDALLSEARRLGVELRAGARVVAVHRETRHDRHAVQPAFTVVLAEGTTVAARALVLATGGRSLPKSGSDGAGYGMAQALGHGMVATTPALAPLVLDGERHVALAGRSHPATLTLTGDHGKPIVLTGSLLWTHFGISGPVALNMSRHWHRARLTGAAADLRLSLLPDDRHASIDAWLIQQAHSRPKAHVSTILATRLPAAVAERWGAEAGVGECPVAQLPREARRRLGDCLVNTRLDVRDSRGYAYAEVTAGGVPLDEIDPRTMESRVCPGLHLVGEILDVDGRLGGFNFQWAWSSAWVAGHALARAARVSVEQA
jgi:predicted Rossmann fold flavoprotein